MLLASLLSPNHCSPKIHKQWPFFFLRWLFTLGLYPSVSAPLCSPCVSHMVNRLRIWIMREWTPLLEYGSLLQRMNWEQLQQEVSIWERRSVQIDSDVHTYIDLSLGGFFLSYLLFLILIMPVVHDFSHHNAHHCLFKLCIYLFFLPHLLYPLFQSWLFKV